MIRRVRDRIHPWRSAPGAFDAPFVAVIGAGPAGLASAAVLQHRGYRATVIDSASDVGGSWPHRYDALKLNTIRWMSDLPGLRMSAGGRWPTRDAYSDYLRSYAQWHSVHCRLNTRVERIAERNQKWLVHQEGEREPVVADGVVVATGAARRAHLPDWHGRATFEGTIMHSNQYQNPTSIPPGKVLVIGGGSSGGELVVDLVASGREVTWSIRTAPPVVPREYRSLPTTPFALPADRLPNRIVDPVGSWFERLAYGRRDYLPAPPAGIGTLLQRYKEPLTADGIVSLLRSELVEVVGPVEGFGPDRVRVGSDESIPVDVVIAATGYTTGLTELLPDHAEVLTDRDRPTQLNPRRGLGFVGFRVPLAGTLYAIDADAHTAASRLLS